MRAVGRCLGNTFRSRPIIAAADTGGAYHLHYLAALCCWVNQNSIKCSESKQSGAIDGDLRVNHYSITHGRQIAPRGIITSRRAKSSLGRHESDNLFLDRRDITWHIYFQLFSLCIAKINDKMMLVCL